MIATGATGCSKKAETPAQPGNVNLHGQADEPVILAGGSVLLIGRPQSGYAYNQTTGTVVYEHNPATPPVPTPPVKVVIGLGDATDTTAETRFEFPITDHTPQREVAAVQYQNGGPIDLSVRMADDGKLAFIPNGHRLRKLRKPYLFVVKGRHPERVIIRNATAPAQPAACSQSGPDVACRLQTTNDVTPTINFCFSQACRIE